MNNSTPQMAEGVTLKPYRTLVETMFDGRREQSEAMAEMWRKTPLKDQERHHMLGRLYQAMPTGGKLLFLGWLERRAQ